MVYVFCFCEFGQLKRWILGRPRTAHLCRRRTLWGRNTTTKPNASLTTSPQTLSPGNYETYVCTLPEVFVTLYNIYILCARLLRRTTWAEEKKLNMETFGVPGRFLRGRGFRGRGRGGQSTTEQRPLPKIGSGRV